MGFQSQKSEKKLLRLLSAYMPMLSSRGFTHAFLQVGKNAKASMRHISKRARRSSLIKSQNTIKIKQAVNEAISPRVIFFSPYLRESIKIIAQTSVLAARAPNHQIFS